MAEVFRGKMAALSGNALFGYTLHGATAVLTLWLLTKALSG